MIAAIEPNSPQMRPSSMKGPRTNQLLAPTSFMTSISRRRAKIDSRIVFAIRMVEAIKRMTEAERKTNSITLATSRTRSVVSRGNETLSTPGGSGSSALAMTSTSSAFRGLTSHASGSGLEARLATSSGKSCSILTSASSRETNVISDACGREAS